MSFVNSQLAESNMQNSYLRTAQSSPGESGINDLHEMCEPQQQDYPHSNMYYDENDIEQQEYCLRLITQNPCMPSDFNNFLN